jgi:DNA-binding response OmpR family regulator
VPLKQPIKSGPIQGLPAKFILLGEDDLDDEELLREVFTAIDDSFSLVFIHNGRELINYLAEVPDEQFPCLIILDYNMPELNGAEILKEMKRESRFDSIPKIIWSTSGSDTYKTVCLSLGACEYLIKPSNIKELESTTRHILSFCTL